MFSWYRDLSKRYMYFFGKQTTSKLGSV